MMATHVHPLDLRGREAQAMETSELSQFVAPGIREDELRQLFESLPAEVVQALLFAVQGAPPPAMPIGGD